MIRLKTIYAQFEQSFLNIFYILFVCVELQTLSFRELMGIINMRKIYFYESNPESKIWEKTIENVEGKIIAETPWRICETQN
ncbi:hypothetical protein [Nitrosopumilus zosterae]|uniref:hypothetical protein n=1 Tax=Nitrosopumilus zosterae TaxID=718286 RepID=UPI0011B240FB|nr:hypothetical protein [Nitrosopumilus zosterae]